MKLSTKLRYSVRMLMLLAEEGRIINTTELGTKLGVSPLYLRNLAIELEKKGFIKSYRGAQGGYKLVKDPSQITLLDVTRIYEDLSLVPCIDDPDACPFSFTCKSRKVWMKFKNCIEEFLASTTLKDIMEEDQ